MSKFYAVASMRTGRSSQTTTATFADFCETRLVHPGLLVMPTVARNAQKRLLDIALDHIEQQTNQSGATDPGEFMINRVVEIDEEGVCTDFRFRIRLGTNESRSKR